MYNTATQNDHLVRIFIFIIILTLSCWVPFETFVSRKWGTMSELQNRTGRSYPCVISDPAQSEIDAINARLAETPQVIPKTIHQIWISLKAVPWDWIDSFRKTFRDAYPGWEYRRWCDTDIQDLQLDNQVSYDAETTYHGKADILRYELLYRYGDIYIDADCQWVGTRDLAELITPTNNNMVIYCSGV